MTSQLSPTSKIAWPHTHTLHHLQSFTVAIFYPVFRSATVYYSRDRMCTYTRCTRTYIRYRDSCRTEVRAWRYTGRPMLRESRFAIGDTQVDQCFSSRDSRFTIRDTRHASTNASRVAIHDSRFAIHDTRRPMLRESRFAIHDSRFAIHDTGTDDSRVGDCRAPTWVVRSSQP